MAFTSLEEMIMHSTEQHKALWEIIMEDDMHDRDASKEDSWKKMCRMWEAMLASVENYEGDIHSESGLVGGMGAKMETYGK
ncbi:MAG: L-serine ammonia-lyase, iron-sulfur-dependent, subunit alpha, partial [Lachnospiraceae bacterium]|nr:L-serine ammonia-lyase, iron-sulfur-dependent, subunit alpha [Lachnospiraceae bacterium]